MSTDADTFEVASEPRTGSARDQVIPVVAVVMTKNEERDLPNCLSSLLNFAEVFVVDSGSADQTCAIAAEFGAKVIDFRWNGQYPKKKQWCLDNLPFSHDWVLYVDADESVSSELAEEIAMRVSDQTPYAGFYIGLDYVFLGRVLRHGQQLFKLALLDRTRARFPRHDDLGAANMWEVEGHYQPIVDGRVTALRARLVHYDHDSLFEYFERQNRYSDWEAFLHSRGMQLARIEGHRGMRKLLARLFVGMPLKPGVFFIHSYVMRGGFLDGSAGFHYALGRAFYYWQIGIKAKELRASGRRDASKEDSVADDRRQATEPPMRD